MPGTDSSTIPSLRNTHGLVLSARLSTSASAIDIAYTLPVGRHKRLALYDSLDHEVRAVSLDKQEPGNHIFEIATGDLPGGLYFCRLSVDEVTTTRQLLITH